MPNNFSQRTDQKQAKRITKSLNQLAAKVNFDLSVKMDRQSGAGNIKGDVNDFFFKYELKNRKKPSESITIKKKYYDKIQAECLTNLTSNQIPAVVFGFGDEDDIFSIRWKHFIQLFKEFLEWKKDFRN